MEEDAAANREVDRVSKLPRELLDYIFELAHEDYGLATLPPSKHLKASHERALYRRLRIRDKKSLSLLAASLKASSIKVHHSLRISFDGYDSRWAPRKDHFRLILRSLPNLIDLEFGQFSTKFAQLIASDLGISRLVSTLETCRFTGCPLTPALLRWLSRNPNLRRVQMSSLVLEKDEEEEAEQALTDTLVSVPQVSEISFEAPWLYRASDRVSSPSILPFFPSAQLTSVNINYEWWIGPDAFVRIVQSLPRTVQRLNLTNEYRSDDYSENLYIDHLLPNFPELQHLQLDTSLFSKYLPHQLSSLSKLVSLSLSFSRDFSLSNELPHVLRNLPRFQLIRFEYFPLEQGNKFDIELAEREVEELDLDLENEDIIPSMERSRHLMDMKGWEFPFEDTLSLHQELGWAGETEDSFRNFGIEVRSNYDQVLKGLHRQLVEYHNRTIGEVYFYRDDYDHNPFYLAQNLNLYLPTPHVDLYELDLFDRQELEWFKEDLREIVGGKEEWYAFNLRYREGVDTDVLKRDHRRKEEKDEKESEQSSSDGRGEEGSK